MFRASPNTLTGSRYRSRGMRRLGGWLLALPLLALAACGGGTADSIENSSAQRLAKAAAAGNGDAAVATVSVQSLVLQAQRRISRTTFEYDYQVVVKNNGAALDGLVAQLSGVGSGTTIVDGTVSIGALAAGATATPADTITLRHERTVPFQQSALVWTFTAETGAMVALPGNPTDQAVDHVPEYTAQVIFPNSEIETDPITGASLLRSKLVIGFQPGSTVAQVNAMLRSIGATIVRTYAKTGLVEVKIADPGSQSALNSLLTGLRAQQVVRYAFAVRFPVPTALPAGLQGGQPSGLQHLAHHLAVKAGPAWNARRAPQLSSAWGTGWGPVLVIADWFGDGVPASGLLNATLVRGASTGFTVQPIPDNHGYGILGTAAGSYNNPLDQADSSLITGLYGATTPLLLEVEDLQQTTRGCRRNPAVPELLDKCKGTTVEDRLRAILLGYTTLDRVVLNTSFALAKAGDDESLSSKTYWLQLLRGGFGAANGQATLEDRFFHAAAAGNDTTLPAKYMMGWARAALESGELTNTAVVENRAASGATFVAGCLAADATNEGNVSAIGSIFDGDGIWVYIDSQNTFETVVRQGGSSLAAPQVAALAASFWAIRRDTTPAELLSIIRSHAVPEHPTPGCRAGQPLIDAYATLLAADEPDALAGAIDPRFKAPVRLAILDVDEDSKFTLNDAKLFVTAMAASSGAAAYDTTAASLTTVQTPTGSKKFDRSRFDLNGDGKVGGAGKARFNLDINYGPGRSSTFGKVPYSGLPGQEVDLDESAVTDFQILCYYVRSALFNTEKGSYADFENYLGTLTPKLSCSAATPLRVDLRIDDTAPGWIGLPTTISMSGLYEISIPMFQLFGNAASAERGWPLFSNAVEPGARFFGAKVVTGVPTVNAGGVVNRDNVSSFFAYKLVTVPGVPEPKAKIWVNATGRSVFGFGSAGGPTDREYQVRYYSGDPARNYVDRKVEVGYVGNSGNYFPLIEARQTSLNTIFAVTQPSQ